MIETKIVHKIPEKSYRHTTVSIEIDTSGEGPGPTILLQRYERGEDPGEPTCLVSSFAIPLPLRQQFIDALMMSKGAHEELLDAIEKKERERERPQDEAR